MTQSASQVGREGRPVGRLIGLPLLLVVLVVGWAWAPMFALHLTGEDYTLLARIDRGLQASPHVFRPLLSTWLTLLHASFGAESGVPYHVASLVLHLLNTTLVFLLGRRLFESNWVAGACAAVFGLGAAAGDALFWVAAVNRPLSAFGALLALNGLVRLGDRSRTPLVLCAVGLVWQFGSNEDFYGTALVVTVWCAWSALGRPEHRRRLAVVTAVALGLLFVHYFVVHRIPGGEQGKQALLSAGPAWVLDSGARRSAAIATGLGMPSFFGYVVPLLGAAAIAAAGRRRAAGLLLLAWVGSFVPFVLSNAVGYRHYPTQAPVALLFAGGLVGVFARSFRWREVPLVGFFALLVLSFLGSRAERDGGLARWHAALAEIRACETPLRELAALQPEEPPVSVNIETTTMGLVYYLWPSIPAPSDVVFCGFLDGATGYVPLEAPPPGTWFGRRCEGSFGVIEPERYFAQRPALEKVQLFREAVEVASLDEARARLTDAMVDLRRVAVVEPAADVELVLDATNADATLAVVEPFEILVPNVSARMKVAVQSSGAVIVGYQDSWLYDPLFRIPPDQTIFSGVRKVRGYVLEATTETGETLATFPLNAYGLGVLVPSGDHMIELGFRKLAPAQMR